MTQMHNTGSVKSFKKKPQRTTQRSQVSEVRFRGSGFRGQREFSLKNFKPQKHGRWEALKK